MDSAVRFPQNQPPLEIAAPEGYNAPVLIGALIAFAPALQPPRLLGVAKFAFPKREIVVPVLIGGHGPYLMLLNTGTSPSVIDLKLAKRIGLKLGGSGQGQAGGNTPNLLYETSLPKVQVAGFSSKNVDCLASDLSGIRRAICRPIEGVLGDSFFSNRVVQFDYPARRVRFYGAMPTPAGRTITLPFKHDDGEVRFGGMRVDGMPVTANLDTGSDGFFSLTPEAIRRLGLEGKVAASPGTHGGSYNGRYQSKAGRLPTIQIGSIKLSRPHVVFWLPGTGHDGNHWDVNVGNRFLQNYVVTVDYRRGLLDLRKHP